MSPQWIVAVTAVASLIGAAIAHAITYTVRHAGLESRVKVLEQERASYIRQDTADLRFAELKDGQVAMAQQIDGLRADVLKILVQMAGISKGNNP